MSTTELQRMIGIASLTEEACTLNVDVVIKDLTKNKTAKESEMRKLGLFCQNVLLNKVVTMGCFLRMQDCKLAKTYGICHIFVKNCVGNLESNSKFYIVSRKTHIEVDMIRSEAYHDLRAKLTPSPLGGVSYEVQQLSLLFRYNRCHLNSPHRPVGVLLHGPPGCGKTSLGKYLAHVHHAVFMNIEGTDILQSEYGSGAVKLKSIFTQAKSLAEEGPVVLFLDEIDTICPAHEKASLGNRQLTGALVLEMDVLHDENVSGLIVVAATNFISSVHPALRRPGRFDNEVLINIPTKEQRMSIMTVYTSDMNLSKDVSIPELASWTVGYVGADLKALCEQAASHAQGTQSLTKKPVVEMPHFKLALHSVSPSLKKGLDCAVELQPVKWDDIGGLEEVKEEIKQAVEWPLLYPEALRRMDVSATKGVLLYGPPGCCKTTLVRAAATACHVTFLSLSGAQVYSPYVGESERIISEAFQKARALSPAILFLDEIESLVGKRTAQGKQSRVQERILSTLLNEMDGVGTRLDKKMDASLTRDGEGDAQQLITNVNLPKNLQHTDPVPYVDKSRVIVIGATNRPDMLDHAIMRPGRLDKLIYVPSPDVQSRLAILKIYTAKMSTQDVDVEELSGNTNNFSGADLKNLCKEAGLVALRESLQVKNTDHSSLFVRHTHFVEAMKTVQGSLQSGEWCKFYGINVR